nr:unnamed protein product [Digitaria exilis]
MAINSSEFSDEHAKPRRSCPPKFPAMAKAKVGKVNSKRPVPPLQRRKVGGRWRPVAAGGGLALAAAAYVGVDYLRHLSPAWHGRLRPALWAALALATAARAPFYRRWDAELRAAPRFLAALAFMLAALLCEAIAVRFTNTVLGLQWHRSWARNRLKKFYAPYASDRMMIWRVMKQDMPFAALQDYPDEYKPEWGLMSFLVDILRPSTGEGPSWYDLLKKSSGGCSDLLYSGHMLVAVLTAMAWTEAYGGWSSVVIWFLVVHSTQREIRERHHYSVDCIVAIYVGMFLWRMTRFLWSARETNRSRRIAKLDEVQNRLFRAAKDSDIVEIRSLLNAVELAGQEKKGFSQRIIFTFAAAIIVFILLFILLAFALTNDG